MDSHPTDPMAVTMFTPHCHTPVPPVVFDPATTGCARFKVPIYCANCGGIGHVYKNCNHPVTSYGVICCRIVQDQDKRFVPEYLMVQRKDSLSYVEFIRGKYSIDKKGYIMKLVSNMTDTERAALRSKTFDDLWKSLWQADDCKAYQREYADAKQKFELIRKGYIMKNDQNEVYYFDIDYIINNTRSFLDEAEWGFPKGRRNINEHDFACAVREFREETGIHPKFIRVLRNQKPFEEVFSGTNKIRYKHIYYLALCFNRDTTLFNPRNKTQCREIKDVRWFRYEDAQSRIRSHNIERKELFRRVNHVILKNLCVNSNHHAAR